MDKAETTTRTTQQIRTEYVNICSQAGEEQFRIRASESKLNQLNQRLAELHAEFSKAEAAETKTDESKN